MQYRLYTYGKKIRKHRRKIIIPRMMTFKRQEGMGKWTTEKADFATKRDSSSTVIKKKRAQYMNPDAT